MGLILPQTVKVHIVPKQIEYYKNKGYTIPTKLSVENGKNKIVYDTYKGEIDVSVTDLPLTSTKKIYYSCDYCNKIIHGTYCNYNRYLKENKYYCYSCSKKLFNSGSLHKNWNPNLSDADREKGRNKKEYDDFVRGVLARDDYMCYVCGNKKDLVAHHLNGFGWYVEGRYDIKNGITLCRTCHKAFHSIYGIPHATKEQFEEWIGHCIEDNNQIPKLNELIGIYCIEENKIYESAKKLSQELKVNIAAVRRVCKGVRLSLRGKHYLYYNDYLKKTPEEISRILSKGGKSNRINKEIICLNNGELYKNSSIINNFYKFKFISYITDSCNKNKEVKNIDGNIFKFMWYEDFEKLSIDSKKVIIYQNIESINVNSFFYYLLQEKELNNEIIEDIKKRKEVRNDIGFPNWTCNINELSKAINSDPKNKNLST